MKRTTVLPILLALLVTTLLPLGGEGRDRVEWSATDPPVNRTHIFEGLINKRGKPVGFHSRPGGKNPANARVVRIESGPNRAGVYTAEVEIRGVGGPWLEKGSTLYPDALSRQEVLQAVLHAFRERTTGRSEKFRGPSGRGFTIEGYFQNGRIHTAYPIFQR